MYQQFHNPVRSVPENKTIDRNLATILRFTGVIGPERSFGMSDGLARMPGHRSVEDAARQSDGILELLPFLPTDYQSAMPLYISMALLFIVISRAARRRNKVLRSGRRAVGRRRAGTPRQAASAARGRVLRPNDGYWGNG